MKRATFDELLRGQVNVTSIINEDYVIDFTVKAESARAIADRRWHMTQEGEAHER